MADQVDALKAQGNAAFTAKEYEKAIDLFSQAIAVAPSNHILYSNRSGAYASSGKYELALEDAEKVIEIKPDWVKGYSRKATALSFLGSMDKALETYREGLKIFPEDPTLKKGMDDLARMQMGEQFDPMAKINEALTSGKVWTTIASNPQLAPHMADPTFVANVTKLQQDPSKLSEMLSDPRMIGLLGALMGMNMPSSPSPSPSEPNSTSSTKKEEESKEEAKVQEEEVPMEVDEETKAKEEALKEKEKGNEAYKKKEFTSALEHYTNAQNLDPENMMYYANASAVYFETNDMEKCRELCHKAVEVGRSNRADYKLVAKAYARLGNSYFKEENYEEAIKWFQKSLTEHRVKDVLEKLNKTEKLQKEIQTKLYIDPVKSAEEKVKGNAFFKENKYPEAIGAYSEAIKRDPTDHVLYSNRAAAYMKLGEFPTAIKDCDKCIEMAPSFVKGYTRKANCQLFLKEHTKALETYETVLKLEPGNKEAEEGIQRTFAAMQQKQTGMSREQIAEEAMKDPEIQGIMADPVMRQILQQMQSDPAAIQ
eukprot:Ihof_evm1s642 gene=Ihof_evmTU1s642